MSRPMCLRSYRFRFLRDGDYARFETTLPSCAEDDARAAAWSCLHAHLLATGSLFVSGEPFIGGPCPRWREGWRITSVTIAPITDLAAALDA